MRIINKRVYQGRNIYSHKKCIRLDVDLCGYCERPSKDIPGFNEGLLKFIPELYTHRCGIDEDHGFVTRLKEGTYLAHICEHIIIAIQNKLDINVEYGKSREIKGDLYYIVFQYEYSKVAIEAANLAVDIINSLINQKEINFVARMNLLKELMVKEAIGPSTKGILEAAKRHNIPYFELGDSGIYQMGYGKQGRIIEATISGNTSCIASDIACDKLLTKELLRAQRLPIARGYKISNIINLLQGGEELSYPLVLKPQYGNKGKGVIANIQNEKALIKGYTTLKKEYDDILLEEYIEGMDYRVCVVDYKVIAVSLRVPPYIEGDGVKNIKTLINNLNEEPNRGYNHEKPLTKVKIDDELLNKLTREGVTFNYVPKKGEKVFLRENANLSTGGYAVDCTEEICKENIDICVRTAKAIGLDICGIDIKSKNISLPLNNQGAIIEVNAAPGIRMHLFPTIGKTRDVGEAIFNMLYKGEPKNIPVVAITGTNGKTTTTRLVSHVLSSMGYTVGMTSTEGIYVDGKCIDEGDDTGFESARTILQNKDVEACVFEVARGGLIRKGLAYDLADVSIITNITEDHLGIDGVNSIKDLAFVKSLVGEAVKDDGYVVLNGDDKETKGILSRITKKKIFFASNKDNPYVKRNILEGGIGIYVEDDIIKVSNNNRVYNIIPINDLPISLSGVLDYNIENAMAACGALIALEVDYCMIGKAFKSFALDINYNKGRFNVYDVNGIEVILDYGHNVDGYKRVLSSLEKLNINNLYGVIGVPGDRTNSMIDEIGRLCGKAMKEVIIKEDKDKRGRKEGEVAELLKKSVENNQGIAKIILNELEGLQYALKKCNPGDAIIVFYEEIESLVKYIEGYNGEEELNIANI